MLLEVETKLEENPVVIEYVTNVGIILLVIFITIISLIWCFKLIESIYIDYIGGKPLFRHLYYRVKDLKSNQKRILESQFKFYNTLSAKERRYFRHRVHKFLNTTEFVGKDGVIITDQHRVLIAATAIMLTFGYRDYAIKLVDKILIYPSSFYSNLDKAYHKGHFNPGFRAVILSWEDFLIGYKIDDDNLNLGIHEFIHALHLSYLKAEYKNEVTAYLFLRGLEAVMDYINSNAVCKNKIRNSDYFREYAFENDFEFVAVLIESFIETPSEFKTQFPEIYDRVKQMLNFNFKGY
ncbi:zinc-dependent peptidase [Olleya sp. HaHaR_3_96]|uniref:zinc-dependent peptidase n=1 Tax=Olleya sp. HaHaR_3_96 TaxID=2745560 RepID=UPI001C4EC52C|nr:zinc-dependent peptidase [Olleya sp. HaHaR_3_96]QXP61148.1 zinc-dependent peptidase [Olleya sp. HaHaR_3_96]